jgi:putative transposase
MKASKFSDAQKAFILKQGADGVPVADICRKAGISPATYFNWKKKYDGLLPTEMKRLKQLEDENGRLRKLVADLSLDRRCCKTSSAENSEAWSQTRVGSASMHGMGRVDPAGLPGSRVRHLDLPLQGAPPRPDRHRSSDQGDLPDAGTLRLPTSPRVTANARVG